MSLLAIAQLSTSQEGDRQAYTHIFEPRFFSIFNTS